MHQIRAKHAQSGTDSSDDTDMEGLNRWRLGYNKAEQRPALAQRPREAVTLPVSMPRGLRQLYEMCTSTLASGRPDAQLVLKMIDESWLGDGAQRRWKSNLPWGASSQRPPQLQTRRLRALSRNEQDPPDQTNGRATRASDSTGLSAFPKESPFYTDDGANAADVAPQARTAIPRTGVVGSMLAAAADLLDRSSDERTGEGGESIPVSASAMSRATSSAVSEGSAARAVNLMLLGRER